LEESFYKNFFTIGIFADAKENIESFNFNVYMSYILQQSLVKRDELQKIYDKALIERDTKTIQECKRELDLFDNSFALTATMLEKYEMLN
jgi:hypothetical protein